MAIWRVAVAVLLVAGLASCGGSPRAASGVDPSPRVSAPATDPGSTPVPAASTASKKAFTAAARRVVDPVGTNAHNQQGGYAPTNNMRLTVTMSKTCLSPGDRMDVVAETVKGAQVGFAAAYSDNNVVPDMFWARSEANPTGTVRWTFVLKPTTPPGPAWLAVVAAKKPNRGASYEGTFRVASSC